MRLLLIRHAIAVERGAPGAPDDERALTPRGRERFRQAAKGLRRLVDAPDVLFSSPLIRAAQTAQIAARAWGGPKVTMLPALATGDRDELARALERVAGERFVALVGHEPHMSELLAFLLGGRSPERLVFRKGGAALLDVPGRLGDGGTLVWFLPPRLLRRLAR